jgi:hypothetical protein
MKGGLMKRFLLIAGCIALAFSVIALAGCGNAGDTSISASWDDASSGIIASLEGFPSGWSFDATYSIAEGSYSGGFAEYDFYTYDFVTYYCQFYDMNSGTGTLLYGTSVNASTYVNYYLNNYWGYANGVSYSIEPYIGLFPGMSGDNRDYSLYFYWDYTYSFTGNTIAGKTAKGMAPKANLPAPTIIEDKDLTPPKNVGDLSRAIRID